MKSFFSTNRHAASHARGSLMPWAWLAAMALAVCACGDEANKTNWTNWTNWSNKTNCPNTPFTTYHLNGFTPVKSQGNDQTCWAYAMLAAIETTHISMGDSVHLSPHYAVRHALAHAFRLCFLTGGERPVGDSGTGHTLLRTMERHGMVAHDAYQARSLHSTHALARRLGVLAVASAEARSSLATAERRASDMLTQAMGPPPRHVWMLGAEYTPGEFGRSVCAPGEYVALTSFAHHPFYEDVVLELPCNTTGDTYLNVPLDTLMSRITSAVLAGHGVCWEGDISEPGFSFEHGVATLPPHTNTSQEARQRLFERRLTTDDHCMAIVGLARDRRGQQYFVMKNSWGTANPYGGLMYVSAEYARLKTIAAYMPRQSACD